MAEIPTPGEVMGLGGDNVVFLNGCGGEREEEGACSAEGDDVPVRHKCGCRVCGRQCYLEDIFLDSFALLY